MFNKTFLVALILCACYFGAILARPDVLDPVKDAAGKVQETIGGVAGGATGGAAAGVLSGAATGVARDLTGGLTSGVLGGKGIL